MFNNIIQVIMALILLIILAIIAYSIYNKEIQTTLYNMTKSIIIKKRTNIFQGVMPINENTQPVFNTSDPSNGSYRNLGSSINQKGGAEYTYNFWLYNSKDTNGDMNKNKVIPLFLKGNDKMSKYTSDKNCLAKEKWFMIKNPLVLLVMNEDSKFDAIITEFNSITHPDAFYLNSETPNCTDKINNNFLNNHLGIYGISKRNDLDDKWIMITIIVQETNPSTDILFRNKANIKMYLNGFEQLNKETEVHYNGTSDNSGSTAMKNNAGNIYINPISKASDNTDIVTENEDIKIQFADLTYFNYVLTTSEIINLHKAGFTKGPAVIPNPNTVTIKNEKANLELNSSLYIKPF
jgi:hypothetical protein